MVDWERITETRGWNPHDDARSLKTDLRRKLAPPAEEVRLRLSSEHFYSPPDHPRWEGCGPFSRLVWVGDLASAPHDSYELFITLLTEPIAQADDPHARRIVVAPVLWLRDLSPGGFVEIHESQGSSRDEWVDLGPLVRFPNDEWMVDCWFSRRDILVTTAEEFPAFRIATLAAHPDFAATPLFVAADRPARRLLIVPCWEVFRHYYTQSIQVARWALRFPSWEGKTLAWLLKYFDGHLFRLGAERMPETRFIPKDYAALCLEAIGRDAMIACARTGRAQLRALPPHLYGSRMRCVGIPARLGIYDVLFVQKIIGSWQHDGTPGVIRWKRHWERSRRDG